MAVGGTRAADYANSCTCAHSVVLFTHGKGFSVGHVLYKFLCACVPLSSKTWLKTFLFTGTAFLLTLDTAVLSLCLCLSVCLSLFLCLSPLSPPPNTKSGILFFCFFGFSFWVFFVCVCVPAVAILTALVREPGLFACHFTVFKILRVCLLSGRDVWNIQCALQSSSSLCNESPSSPPFLFVFLSLSLSPHTHTHTHAHARTHTCAHTYYATTHTHAHTHTHARTHAHVRTHIVQAHNTHTTTHPPTHTHTHTHTHYQHHNHHRTKHSYQRAHVVWPKCSCFPYSVVKVVRLKCSCFPYSVAKVVRLKCSCFP